MRAVCPAVILSEVSMIPVTFGHGCLVGCFGLHGFL